MIASSNRRIFVARNKRQPLKQLVVKLSDDNRELDFFQSFADIEKATDHLVECVEWGEWTVVNYTCYALIIERGEKNCADCLRFLRRRSFARYRCIDHVVRALEFLHSHNWIHGDIKLDNVVKFGDDKGYKLIDLDHAKQIGSHMHQHCTAEYCPPEMAKYFIGRTNSLLASDKFDIWCLAVFVLKLFLKTDVMPEFVGLDNNQVVQRIASPDFNFNQSLEASDLELPQKRRLARCLHPDPAQRGTLKDIMAILPVLKPMTESITVFKDPNVASFSTSQGRSTDLAPARVLDHPVPCIWTLDGVTGPPPQGGELRRTMFVARFLCEMRNDSSQCEYFPQSPFCKPRDNRNLCVMPF